MGFRALQHGSTRRIRFARGFHAPAPSALEVSHLPDGLLSSAPRDDPSIATAFLGFALQGLAPPGQRYPSRGLASLVVLPQSRRTTVATSEVGSDREGARTHPRPQTRRPKPCLPGVAPLQGFLLRTPSNRLPGPSPSCLSGWKCSLRFHFQARLQGIVSGESGLSLSRLPALLGFRTFRNRACR